ncbi:hypothetical protein ACF06W_32940 [Streptomyces albus]|uniref:hypothetical protein n=1 Tax=Streptomyces albus TaxID=1888 RepID=UPI0037004868
MVSFQIALNVTPAGIPVVGALMVMGFFLFLIWDALRKAGEPWFRWLLPGGFVVLLAGIALGLAVIIIGGILMGAGMGLSNYWRWTGRNALKRDDRRKKPPPVFRPRRRQK